MEPDSGLPDPPPGAADADTPTVEIAVDPARYSELMGRLQCLALEHPRAAGWQGLINCKSPAWWAIQGASATCGPGERNGTVRLVRIRKPVLAQRDPRNPARPVFDPKHPERTQTTDVFVDVPIVPTEKDCRRLREAAGEAFLEAGIHDEIGTLSVRVETLRTEGIFIAKLDHEGKSSNDGLPHVVGWGGKPAVVVLKGFSVAPGD